MALDLNNLTLHVLGAPDDETISLPSSVVKELIGQAKLCADLASARETDREMREHWRLHVERMEPHLIEARENLKAAKKDIELWRTWSHDVHNVQRYNDGIIQKLLDRAQRAEGSIEKFQKYAEDIAEENAALHSRIKHLENMYQCASCQETDGLRLRIGALENDLQAAKERKSALKKRIRHLRWKLALARGELVNARHLIVEPEDVRDLDIALKRTSDDGHEWPSEEEKAEFDALAVGHP